MLRAVARARGEERPAANSHPSLGGWGFGELPSRWVPGMWWLHQGTKTSCYGSDHEPKTSRGFSDMQLKSLSRNAAILIQIRTWVSSWHHHSANSFDDHSNLPQRKSFQSPLSVLYSIYCILSIFMAIQLENDMAFLVKTWDYPAAKSNVC